MFEIKPTFKKLLISVLICSATYIASADSAIFTPRATVLGQNLLHLKGYYATGFNRWQIGSAAIGLGSGFEASFSSTRLDNGSGGTAYGLQYLIVPSFADTSPGVTVGVKDISNNTANGTQGYIGISQAFTLDADLNRTLSGYVTVGYLAGKKRASPFFNLMVPLGSNLNLIAENDGDNFNAGFDFIVNKTLSFRVITKGNSAMLAVALSHQF